MKRSKCYVLREKMLNLFFWKTFIYGFTFIVESLIIFTINKVLKDYHENKN